MNCLYILIDIRKNIMRQVSAGGVVFKKRKGAASVCLIQRCRGSKVIWCLPKGHVEKKESLRETAIREVKEETGLAGSVVKKVDRIAYWFYEFPPRAAKNEKKLKIFKTVHFFLIRYRSGSTRDHDHEAEEVRWFSLKEALRVASYKNERLVIEKAEQILKQLS